MSSPTYDDAATQLARASYAVKRMMIAAENGPEAVDDLDLLQATLHTRTALDILAAIATRTSAIESRNTTTRANDTEQVGAEETKPDHQPGVYESTAQTPGTITIISDVDDSEVLPGETRAHALFRLNRAAIIRDLGQAE